MPLIEQEHLRSPPVLSGVRVVRYLVFCVVFCRSLFVLFRLAIVLSVLWFTYSDYAFGIFKLFLFEYIKIVSPTYFWNISIKIVLWVGKKEGKCQCSIPLTHFYPCFIPSRQRNMKFRSYIILNETFQHIHTRKCFIFKLIFSLLYYVTRYKAVFQLYLQRQQFIKKTNAALIYYVRRDSSR